MKNAIVRQLNTINRYFYSDHGADFADTRQSGWPGWERLENIITSLSDKHGENFHCLDLGCGNARFADFVCETLTKHNDRASFQYTGIDISESLLDRAEKRLNENECVESSRLEREDFVSTLRDDAFLGSVTLEPRPQLIVSMAVLHHIPSLEIRRDFITKAFEKLASGGAMIVTTWQFWESQKLREKIVHPDKVGLDPVALEEHDHILDWNAGDNETGYRYCHYVSDAELPTLLRDIPKETTVSTYRADGSNNQMNRYVVLIKN